MWEQTRGCKVGWAEEDKTDKTITLCAVSSSPNNLMQNSWILTALITKVNNPNIVKQEQ